MATRCDQLSTAKTWPHTAAGGQRSFDSDSDDSGYDSDSDDELTEDEA